MICTVDARPERADVRVGGVRAVSRVLAVLLDPPAHRADQQRYPARRTPLPLRNNTDKPVNVCRGVPGSLVGVMSCCPGLPVI